MRTVRSRASLAVLACLVGTATASCRTATSRARSEGVVEIAAGYPILVRTGDGLELIEPAPGATLLGMEDIDTPDVGDPIRWVASRDGGGVKVADVIELAPLVQTDLDLRISSDRARDLFAAAPAQRGGAIAVDARPADEYARGHLAGAISLPPDGLDRASELLPPDRGAELVFYSRGPRCSLAVAALRRALALGYSNAKVYLGGMQQWTATGTPLEVSAPELAELLKGREPPLVLDVRPREEAERGAIPGSVSRPLAELSPAEFQRGVWLPPIVLVGRDGDDPDAHEAAARLRQWRFLDMRPVPQRFVVLAGGFRGWASGGRPAATGPLPNAIPYRAAPGEIPPVEFVSLWNAGGEGARVQFLDVRSVSVNVPPWVKHIRLEELASRLGELPKDRELVVFCNVGKRSTIARELLERNGFRARTLRARFPQPAF